MKDTKTIIFMLICISVSTILYNKILRLEHQETITALGDIRQSIEVLSEIK